MNRLKTTAFYSLMGTTAIASLSSFTGKEDRKEEKDRKPMNVVYIMCDDHSYQTISAYDNRFIQTPNIDRIAADGVRFTNSFVANSLSGPSRACMLTGKHSHANGFTDNSTSTFDGSQQTFPKLLQAQGYQTAMIGKWHLGGTPTGFNYWDILIGQGDYYNPTFINNGKRQQREGYATNIITDLAIDWMDNKREKDKPFCLLIHHKAPHRTWMPDTCDLDLYNDVKYPIPANFYDKYEGRIAASTQEMSIIKDMDLVYDLKMADKENEIHTNTGLEAAGRRMYNNLTPAQKAAWDKHYDPVIKRFKEARLTGKELAEWKYQQYMHDYLRVIHSVDRNIGRVLDYLEKNGLMENTMIVYTSDQGFYMGEHGWFDKRFMYEESFRTPLLVHLPGGKRGDVEQMVQNIDYGPTILDLAGVKTPQDMHGVSFLPLLKGKKVKNWRKALYYHFYEYPAEHAVKKHYGIRTERYKLIHFYNDIDCWELYDLKKDPAEMHNLYEEKGMEPLIKKLKKELIDLEDQYNAPIRD
ncbi:sulfatase [Bacteroides helcogenes]|uniref:Sulfatase n=1 Tax=Bacteroides helcogenes (strain ATCC 35417 / DSM 20613 / JCM 6297 / CCUG 15421 / P 36-108) TaxID=693979 RepID=E6SVH3_BACT6|nr:sulfatase [Bacteroides helcogenes]ADV42483.1 sulfatase [Bacteroides helcogenes P 36-108]MDY5237756.1 sulfatase [Bacteroides helcogenes]